MNHSEMFELIRKVAPELSPSESMAVRAVAWHETKNGEGWKPPGVGSFNMGAITTADPKTPSFQYSDSRFDAKQGKVVNYVTSFKKYDSPDAGLRDLIRTVLKPNVRALIPEKGLRGVAEGMYANHYYLGTSPSDEVNQQRYHAALESATDAITKGTGEPYPFAVRRAGLPLLPSPPSSLSASLPVLCEGSKGSAVSLWQRFLRIHDDGDFGPITLRATLRFQSANGMPPSGRVEEREWRTVRF